MRLSESDRRWDFFLTPLGGISRSRELPAVILFKQRAEGSNFIAGDGDHQPILRDNRRTNLLVHSTPKAILLRHASIFEEVQRPSIVQWDHFFGGMSSRITGKRGRSENTQQGNNKNA